MVHCYIKYKSKFVFLAIAFMLFLTEAYSQTEPMSVDGRASGQWAYTLEGIQSSFSNQAGLAGLKSFGIAAYAEKTHWLPEFANVGLAVGWSTGENSGMSVNFSSYGIEEFRQNRIGLAYGMRLTSDFRVGVQIDWYQTSIEGYGQNSQLTFRLGGIYNIFPSLKAGVHFSNPVGMEISGNHPLPSDFNFDLEWLISSQLSIGTGLKKSIEESPGFKAAVHYQIHPNFKLMFGAITRPARFSFGFALDLNDFSLQSAGSYHQHLGFSPAAGITFER